MHWKATFIASIRDILPVYVVSTEPVGQVVNRLSLQQFTPRVALASGKKPFNVAPEHGDLHSVSSDRKRECRRDIARDFYMTKQIL